MTEQYIYSRSEREFTNALGQRVPLGFGFMALSPGMDKALKQDVAAHCEDCPRIFQTDSQGVPLPLFRKACLSKRRVLLQKSTWIDKGSRGFHVAHGYVLDDKSAEVAGPTAWLAANFRLGDPNKAPDGIPPLESRLELTDRGIFHPKSLKETMVKQGLSLESFCQLLLACFDAVASRRQVLIAWDFGRPGERELQYSLLYWVYTCLPYDLWISLGFDSVYTDKSSPGLTHLAFVDRTSIQGEGQTLSIQLGNQVRPLGGNFLVQNGGIIHNDGKYKTEWYNQDIAYASWLRQIVNTIWNSPEENRDAVIGELKKIWQFLQDQMDAKPEEKRLNPEKYSGACEAKEQLQKLKEAARLAKVRAPKAKSPKAEPKNLETRLEPLGESKPNPSETYQSILQQSSLKDLLNALDSVYEKDMSTKMGFLGAFMAREADAKEKELKEVLSRCQADLPHDIYFELLARLFGDKLTEQEKDIWNKCGVKSGSEVAEQRRNKLYNEIAPKEYIAPENVTAVVGWWLDSFQDINDGELLAKMKEEFQTMVKRKVGLL